MTTTHLLTILAVTDLPRAVRFYDSAFGWAKAAETPVYVEYMLAGGMRLGLYDRRGFARNTGLIAASPPDSGTTAAELYLRVDDLDAAVARLLAAGAPMLSPPAPREWGDEAAYFTDPDGNVVAVSRPCGVFP